MQLKRIEMAGFKSFPDPTEVVFDYGITAIVGPNGCGKSNLTDAVRWVLGEQRARVLRGGKMEEVIFGGTPQRPPLSASEVTLIIDNKSGGLACDFAEVAVTRRLDRSGDSEYFLNRAPCRLKDLTDLFMDTGMGSHAYSVIQQGMIDAIIAENTDELRYLFEEAAGVSKYKTRKRAALRKLEATESDLVRLTDLKNEVATRTRSLARQKGKAERHRALRAELDSLRLVEAVRHCRRLAESRRALDARLREAEDRYLGLQAQCDAVELEWQTLRMSSDDAERKASEAADRLAAVTAEWHECDTRRVQLRDRRAFLETEMGALRRRIETLAARREDLAVRLTRAEADATETRAGRETAAEAVATAEAAYRGRKEDLARVGDDYQRISEEYAALARERATLATQDAASAERRDNWSRLIAELAARRDRAVEELQRAESACARLRDELGRSETDLAEGQVHLDSVRRRLADLTAAQSAAEGDLRVGAERLREWEAARDLLAGMIARGEGLGAAAEAILADGDRWAGRVTGFSDRLKPKPGWERAVEIALAGRLGTLWCRDQETAQALIQSLLAGAVGSAIVLDPSLLPEATNIGAVNVDGYAGRLSEMVECDPEVRPWVDALLAPIVAFERSEDARRAVRSLRGNPVAGGVVSREGLMIEFSGAVRAGVSQGESVLGRSGRLDEFDSRIAAGQKEQTDIRMRIERLASELAEVHGALRTAEGAAADAEDRTGRLRLQLEAEGARLAEHKRAVEELERDLNERRTSLATDEESRSKQLELGRSLDERLADLSARREDAERLVQEAEQLMAATGVAVNDARIRSVEAAAQADAAETECRRMRDGLEDIDGQSAESSGRLDAFAQETERIAGELTSLESRHVELTDVRRRLEDDRATARATASERREVFSSLDIRVKEIRRERDEADRQRAQVTIEQSRLEAEMDQYRERVRETLNADPLEASEPETPMSDGEVKSRAADLGRQIESLGPVNPLALEEYEIEKQRWDFFENQLADLRAAKRELTETITELNRTAGERFTVTFETARQHFQEVFTELFRGGEADVRLLDPADPLESPIEIFARPRGKKFIGLRQLSGGERALTAIALLFGLYLVKPSPFCILDEVDAPLDDANCGRFLRLLDRFKGRTQFIIVTHNKITMEAADALYGITMETSGVSRVVSVRLNRASEGGEPGLAEPRIEIDANGVEAEG